MVTKLQFEDIGEVSVYKRKGQKRLSLSIRNGKIRVNAPYLVSKKLIENFVINNKGWIIEHLDKTSSSKLKFSDGQRLGPIFIDIKQGDSSKNYSKFNLEDGILTIKLAHGSDIESQSSQNYIKLKLKVAIVKYAGDTLEPMLDVQSERTALEFKGFKTSITKSKWGSCDTRKIIHLNSLLIMLPDELINYVICHELTHLNNMNHSPKFWAELEAIYPNHKQAKLKLKKYSNMLTTWF